MPKGKTKDKDPEEERPILIDDEDLDPVDLEEEDDLEDEIDPEDEEFDAYDDDAFDDRETF